MVGLAQSDDSSSDTQAEEQALDFGALYSFLPQELQDMLKQLQDASSDITLGDISNIMWMISEGKTAGEILATENDDGTKPYEDLSSILTQDNINSISDNATYVALALWGLSFFVEEDATLEQALQSFGDFSFEGFELDFSNPWIIGGALAAGVVAASFLFPSVVSGVSNVTSNLLNIALWGAVIVAAIGVGYLALNAGEIDFEALQTTLSEGLGHLMEMFEAAGNSAGDLWALYNEHSDEIGEHIANEDYVSVAEVMGKAHFANVIARYYQEQIEQVGADENISYAAQQAQEIAALEAQSQMVQDWVDNIDYKILADLHSVIDVRDYESVYDALHEVSVPDDDDMARIKGIYGIEENETSSLAIQQAIQTGRQKQFSNAMGLFSVLAEDPDLLSFIQKDGTLNALSATAGPAASLMGILSPASENLSESFVGGYLPEYINPENLAEVQEALKVFDDALTNVLEIEHSNLVLYEGLGDGLDNYVTRRENGWSQWGAGTVANVDSAVITFNSTVTTARNKVSEYLGDNGYINGALSGASIGFGPLVSYLPVASLLYEAVFINNDNRHPSKAAVEVGAEDIQNTDNAQLGNIEPPYLPVITKDSSTNQEIAVSSN